MKMCWLGKWPPIQGGVSKNNVLSALALARQGFSVDVVTNSPEAEPEFRTWEYFVTSEGTPGGRFPLQDGNLRIHTTEPLAFAYIPYANPFVTKLAAQAADVVTEHDIDVILGVYFEPYGLAAHLAARWTGKPCVLTHAGSDISRLLPSPQLNRAYREMLRSADLVLTGSRTRDVFSEQGIPPEQIGEPTSVGIVAEVYHPKAAPLDLAATIDRLRIETPPDLSGGIYHHLAAKPIDQSLPTIGIYGKIGEAKGSLDLVSALGRLKRDGLRFNFLALSGARPDRMKAFSDAIDSEGLASCTWLLPFAPFHHVAHFIRSCTAVCFLERDFPIKIHTPMIPEEILACGACMVLSEEVAAKKSFASRLLHDHNVFLVDPRKHEDLAGILRLIISDPHRARQVGKMGFGEIGSRLARPLDEYGASLKQTWMRIQGELTSAEEIKECRQVLAWTERLAAKEESASVAGADAQAPGNRPFVVTEAQQEVLRDLAGRISATFLRNRHRRVLAACFPLTAALIPTRFDEILEDHLRGHADPGAHNVDCGTPPDAVELGRRLEIALTDEPAAPAYARDVACYERLLAELKSAQMIPASPPSPDNLPPLHPATVPRLRPGVFVEAFEWDVLAVVKELRQGRQPSPEQRGLPTRLAIRSSGASGASFFRLNAAAVELLRLADGVTTAAEMIEKIESRSPRENVAAQVTTALEEMAQSGLIEWS